MTARAAPHEWRPRLGYVGVVGVIWSCLSAIGNVQTARGLFEHRGPIMHGMGNVLLSPWAGAVVALVCLVLILTLDWPFHRAPTRDEWHAQERRFAAIIDGELDAIWQQYGSGTVRWLVNPSAGAPETGGLRVERLLSEARIAGQMVRRLPKTPTKFASRRDEPLDDADRWFNVVAAAVNADGITGSGHDEHGPFIVGSITQVVNASRRVCAKLAADVSD